MFTELMPLLAGRTVLVTVARVDDKTLRVNIVPARARADENPALTTPLTYIGSPEELDAELGKHLGERTMWRVAEFAETVRLDPCPILRKVRALRMTAAARAEGTTK